MEQFVKRLGEAEAPFVAEFFFSHNNRYYVQQMHSVGAMLRDAEKLRTEWITNSKVTNERAIQLDKTQTNGDVFTALIAQERGRSTYD